MTTAAHPGVILNRVNPAATRPPTCQTAARRRRSSTHAANPRRLPARSSEHPGIQPAGRVVAGRYRLQRLLGRGGMGAVWLAEDQTLHRRVAVKQLLPSGVATDQQRRAAGARLRREARLAARVDHPGTVRVYDLAEDTGGPWIVMEALPGRTLEAALRDHGPLPVALVASVGLWLLEALQATHRAGIVHRDVKPSNVQLCGGRRVVLTDFGIASTTQHGTGTPTGKLVGSPAYMSPEQVHSGQYAPASDLFSLGATLYAAVEGRSPFGKGCPAATLTAVVTDPPAPLRRAGPLGRVIEGLLAKDPAQRLRPDQARDALQAIQSHQPPPPTQAHPPAQPPQPPSQRDHRTGRIPTRQNPLAALDRSVISGRHAGWCGTTARHRTVIAPTDCC